MLDVETRRRIDTARDILVGKVPDPKSQVEQITIALIYKFMWDIEARSEELGGRRRFFVDDFERFAWPKLLRSGLGGFETLSLYSEALDRIPENQGIPPLFRSIFNNAYLPYRDPETLREFLKVIDRFEYDHSERLGDAFEYLLSIMGAQGEAGQFRTPRHIIDFIVEIVNPQLYETVLDPACGTAGFLISAYKHIQRANTDADGQSTLTPHERGRLAESFTGYDISPDMVRLSLVNMYLHGFVQPDIHEYDTLTSEERWDEYADVILANPPFMSPKGGIRPHNRFSVQARRSEVLFVDYMAEHLTPDGRAGIIVPEGIIFQSQKAHTQLRKMLVEDYLVAVVSLPAGVFKPYSGVKTSILILDRILARRTDHIAFFNVDNDGYALGDQRSPIDKNDLPEVQTELTDYLCRVRAGESPQAFKIKLGQVVEKKRVAGEASYNLSGEWYREVISRKAKWDLIPLGDLVKRISGGTPSKKIAAYWNGSIPWVSPKDVKSEVLYETQDRVTKAAVTNSSTTIVPENTVICVVRSGILKHSLPVAITGKSMCFNQDIVALVPLDQRINPWYLYWILRGRSKEILSKGIKTGVTVQSFHSGFFEQFKIPLPPLAVQQEIIAEIAGYQRVIDGARALIENHHEKIQETIDLVWIDDTENL